MCGTDLRDGSTTPGAVGPGRGGADASIHHLPAGLDPAAAAPSLRAGVTVWEPLRALGVGPGTEVAVVGPGGLGHVAVSLAVALGARTTCLTRTPGKAADARRLGVHESIVAADLAVLALRRHRFDVDVDTVPGPHDLTPLLRVVGLDGRLVVLGFLGGWRCTSPTCSSVAGAS